MKPQLLRTVSACALVVAMGGAAFAQSGGSGGGSSPQGGAPSTQQMPSAPQTEERRPNPGAGETVQPKGGAERPAERQPGAAQRGDERTAPRKQDRTEKREQQKSTPRASDQHKEDRARTGQEQGQDKDRARTGQGQRDRGDRATQGQTDRGQDARTQLSDQQRTTVRERFSRADVERNRVKGVNFDVRVGARVPRGVPLRALPADIGEVVPAYRGYRYIYVRDEIVIVNPSSYEVVAVVTGSGNRTAATRDRRVTLAPADRAFVREHIDRGASIRLGIGDIRVGMTVPQGIELLPVPSVVVERIPDFSEYRYFVYEDDIAIVDPSTDEIVLILDK